MLISKAEQRIQQYLTQLERGAYGTIAELEFEFYETDETLRCPPVNADWKKIKTPAPWGSAWKCTWFRAEYTAPLSDNPLFLCVKPNADSLVFIDGKPAGAFNIFHNDLRIEADGKQHTLHIESYAGHPIGNCGPFDGTSIFINTGGTSIDSYPNTFYGGSLKERYEPIYSLFFDVCALFETAKKLDANSLRKAEIIKGLYNSLCGISFLVTGKELASQAAEASKRIAPLLALKNSPTVPFIYLIGHSHIDHAWLWPIEETERKIARTFSNMIRFIKEYPEFIFIQSQPCQLETVKNEYPDIFNAVKDAYKKGNWEPNGGMYVEADCNLISGESLVRQFLVGKKVNKELLGYEADTLWLPDVFGYAAALPQILAGCRIKYFVTSKINWNDTTRFPYETFIWRGIDGTGIKTHFISSGYNGKVTPEEFTGVWNNVQHKEVQSGCIQPIGEGDGGGGTLRSDLEMARRLRDLEGAHRSAWTTVSAALAEIFSNCGELPQWRGELYLELHRGTYTTQSRTKRNNRLLEFALRNAEFLCSAAALQGKAEYPREQLLNIWKRVLINQFHDIIPGSSITSVYTRAEAESKEMFLQLAQLSMEMMAANTGAVKDESSLQTRNKNIFIFNDLSWVRTGIVNVSALEIDGINAVKDDNGDASPVEHYIDPDGNERAMFRVKAPSLGWARFTGLSAKSEIDSPFTWQNNCLETPFYKITFDNYGRIISLIERLDDSELVASGGAFNAFICAEDVPVFWDAWDIDADWVRKVKQETRLVSMNAVADGPVCFRLRLEYKIGATSQLVQDIVCYAQDPRVDFETKVSWHETHRLLKVEFDTAVDAAQVRCEVQYGHLWRNTHRNLMQDRAKFEICAHKWISLEEEGSGIALLNDCKYGHDVEGGRMRLSLLRSPVAPDQSADKGGHRFTYAILPFKGTFGGAGVIRSAYELNSPMSVLFADGKTASQSLCTVEGNSVIIESVKMPENRANDELILRMYESLGGKCRTTLHFFRELKAAYKTDMLEENPQELAFKGHQLKLDFRSFEIKTIRVKFKND